jgi:hypothetical protein
MLLTPGNVIISHSHLAPLNLRCGQHGLAALTVALNRSDNVATLAVRGGLYCDQIIAIKERGLIQNG